MTAPPLRLALVGRGIGHSLSPRLQQELLRLSGRTGDYQLLDGDDWQSPLNALRGGELDGLNVTTPFKRVVADQCQIEQPGPINCVRLREGQLQGWSSDGPGFMDALDVLHPLPPRAQVLLLGTGGAAESLVPALVARGCLVWLWGRNAQTVDDWTQRLPVQRWPATSEKALLPKVNLLIHATRWGHGEPGPPPEAETAPWLALPWLQWANEGAALVDIVYSADRLTWMEQLAESKNLAAVRGFGRSMLAAQAAQGFGYWTGDLLDWRQIASAIHAPVGLQS